MFGIIPYLLLHVIEYNILAPPLNKVKHITQVTLNMKSQTKIMLMLSTKTVTLMINAIGSRVFYKKTLDNF